MKKVLVVFGEGTKKETLIESALFFKDSFGYEIVPLYIRDIRKDEILASSMDGIIVNVNNSSFSKERDELEEEEINKLQVLLDAKNIKSTLFKEFGFPWDVIKEYMKTTDLLIFEKGEFLSETVIAILKEHFKPVILIGENPIKSMNNVGIASDDGVKINKSTFAFINTFPEIKKFDMLTMLKEIEENYLLKYLTEKGKIVVNKHFDSETAKEDCINAINNLDLLVMGNLSKSYFFEKITRRKGLSILEDTTTTIFIG